MDPVRCVPGLEIGMESAGRAVLRNGGGGEPCKMERLGVAIFGRAENPDGSSPSSARREAGEARRMVRRRRHRVRLLPEKKGILSREEISALHGERKI